MLKFFNSKQNNKEDNKISIDLDNIPKHIAIIMDGNGRWAKEKRLPRTMGHKAGVEVIREIVKECSNLGVKYLTLYAFSTENWVRPKEEVSALMNLLTQYLRNEFKELNDNNVVINHIGNVKKLPQICQDELTAAYEKSKNNTGLVLNLALNYGGRDELIRAFKDMYIDIREGKVNFEDLDEKLFSNYLDTKGMPDPDLIIRPSGEQRLSNFLLWQCAYSEFWYSNIKWPDFNKKHLHEAIYDFQNRNRRYGGLR
ncbi:isoprenyl transferase [Clostridium sp. DJ247]|uniref:isoprenyl transferase n=1 Tax=Clostridium sp. DJ247 TaxID=2726188 RepID=UPI0016240161|nr:isoprenyl transferase [Clostridium sp. DJ247]MBC2578926.1 isoprenyl transferase [Clostridium sp. DJ247]